MACWAFEELLEDSYDIPKLIKFALLYNLGEIEAGDTFLYSKIEILLILKSANVLKNSLTSLKFD